MTTCPLGGTRLRLPLVTSASPACARRPPGRRPAWWVAAAQEHQPYAAVDGDLTTSWQAAPGIDGRQQWLSVSLDKPTLVRQVVLRFDLSANAVPTNVTVSTGAESATDESFGAEMTLNPRDPPDQDDHRGNQ